MVKAMESSRSLKFMSMSSNLIPISLISLNIYVKLSIILSRVKRCYVYMKNRYFQILTPSLLYLQNPCLHCR